MRTVGQYHVMPLLTLAAIFVVALPCAAQGPAPETYQITFRAVLDNRDGHQRLVAVKPDPESLKKIKGGLHPGDRIMYSVERRLVVRETWSRPFHWEVTKKRGKNKIKEQTHQTAERTIELNWGVSIAPQITLGDAKLDVLAAGRQEVVIHQYFDGETPLTVTEGVKVEAPVSVDRPGHIPANAEGGPVTVTISDASGNVIGQNAILDGCIITIAVERASR